ncbi:MAG: PASTA domain-containing protein [Anaerolineae bacterium]|nr:PASTA domain-containing protein [Anaerolineae bacterium]
MHRHTIALMAAFTAALLFITTNIQAQEAAVTVPDVTGMTAPKAASALNDARFLLGGETAQTLSADTQTKLNQVIAQEPAPGQKAAPGTAVKVTIVRNPNVVITYDANSLTFTNRDSQPLDLTGVLLESGADKDLSQFSTQEWGKTLAVKNCYQLWKITPSKINLPPECSRAARVSVTGLKNKLFWLSGQDSFRVRRYGDTLAACPVSAGRCEVALLQGDAVEQADFLMFAYRANYFTVRNESNRWMSLDDVTIIGGDGERFTLDATSNTAPGDVLWSGNRLAPGQCIVYAALEVGALPPYDCKVVGYIKLPQQTAFWTKGFSLVSVGTPRSSYCPAPQPGLLSICVRPR